MTLDELANELNLQPEDVVRVCAALQIPQPGPSGFSMQQVLRINTHILSRGAGVASDVGPGDFVQETPPTISRHDTVTGGTLQRPLSSVDLMRLVFAERFDFLQELGSGGMGRVLKGLDRIMQREVAVKRLKNLSGWDDDLLGRFVREARLAGRLNHPNIMTVYDILIDDEGPYLVLEFIDGESLATRLERGPIPWPTAIDLLTPICDAMTAAHAQGIIHRDIKPANILVSKSGIPKLGDFGIARSLEGHGMTQTGAALGTLDYMAPEQMSSARTADARADVYSLAATLYHMVTGEVPRPISADELPTELRSFIVKALHRRPENRPASVVEFARGLAEIRRTGTASSVTEHSVPPTSVSAPILPLLQGYSAQVAQATGNEREWQQKAQQALEKFDYAVAVELLEHIPLKFLNQQQWRDAVAKRDRVAELEVLISQLVAAHDYRKLAHSLKSALELQPTRDDYKALQATLPDICINGGMYAGERTVIEILGLKIAFRWCPPGSFKMGSRDSMKLVRGENQVQVLLTTGFWLGETVVTQELYQALLGVAPSHFHGAKRPVETVSWYDAQEFCEAMTLTLKAEGILTSRTKVALPTEAQWEYACRAGTTTSYYFGNDVAHLKQFAWFDGNAGGETHPVGTRDANPWGLRDMSGNVWEWCADWYGDKLVGGKNPLGPAYGSKRVSRGGGWRSAAEFCQSEYRRGFEPPDRISFLGFRVCLNSD